jgi:hypothetical protein
MDEERQEEPDPALPEPQILGCYFDQGFSPALAAMRLRWPGAANAEWWLPSRIRLQGPPPARYGVRIKRFAPARYAVSLVWDGLCLRLAGVTKEELLDSALARVLAAMDGNLPYLLEQPVLGDPGDSLAVA